MSNLPNIDAAVTQDLNALLSEKTYQAIQYKALAEALLKERDEAKADLDALKAQQENTPISGTVVGD